MTIYTLTIHLQAHTNLSQHHCFLQLMNCISEKSSESRVSSFPMKDLGGSGRSSAYQDRSLDAPVSILHEDKIANPN